MGIEPMTQSLKGFCSTSELMARNLDHFFNIIFPLLSFLLRLLNVGELMARNELQIYNPVSDYIKSHFLNS